MAAQDSGQQKIVGWESAWKRAPIPVGPILILGALLWLIIVALTWADTAEAADSGSRDSEYNFSWLDPDKKIYVLQNRKFTKAGRVQVSAAGGTSFSLPYRTSFFVDPRLSFYFHEDFGLELFGMFSFNQENSTFKSLLAAPVSAGQLPVVREINAQYGALLQWVPWYAKLNVFNQILYFDWYFGAGGSLISSSLDKRANSAALANLVAQNPLWGLVLTTGHQYHLHRNFIVRLDFAGTLYPAPLNGETGETTWFSHLNAGIGLGVRL